MPKYGEKLLSKPLQGALPSQVLVTTRDEAIATRMGTIHSHRVEGLSDDDGWSLVCKMVWLDNGDAEDMQIALRDIGMRIV